MFCKCRRDINNLQIEITYLEKVISKLKDRLSRHGLDCSDGRPWAEEPSNIHKDIKLIADHLGLELVSKPSERVLVKKGNTNG